MQKTCSNEYEHRYWAKGQTVLGMDEAGRGPLAGPLSVAGVVFPIGYEKPAIYDSKALSEKKREALYQTIMEDALWFAIWQVSPEEIDRWNIYRADQRAFSQLAQQIQADIILTDAMPLPEITDRQVLSLVKGDQKSISIAAASILAKVTRDQLMKQYAIEYPQYGFEKNKGYPTRQHLQALEEFGPSLIHRHSYRPVAACRMKLKLFDD